MRKCAPVYRCCLLLFFFRGWQAGDTYGMRISWLLKSGVIVVDAAVVSIDALRDFGRCACVIQDDGMDMGLCVCRSRNGLHMLADLFGGTPLSMKVVADGLRLCGGGMID